MVRKGAFSLSVFLLILIAAVVIIAIWTQIVPQYRARAEIRVLPVIPRLVFDTDQNGQVPFYDSFVNTQVSIIRSPILSQRVLDQNEVQETRWYQKPTRSFLERLQGQPLKPHTERLRDALSVAPREHTEVIDVAFTDASSQGAVTILDAVVHEYLEYIGQKTGEATSEFFQKITEEYQQMDNEINGREQVIGQLRKQLGTNTPKEMLSRKRIGLETAEARLADIRMKIDILKWKQGKLESEKDIIASEPNHISGTLIELLGVACTDYEAGLKIIDIQLAQLEYEKQLWESEFEKQQRDFQEIFANTQLLEREIRSLEQKQELFNAVRRRLDEQRVERRGAISTISILSPASVASEPHRDHRVLFTAIAFVLCGLGITVAYWRFRRK